MKSINTHSFHSLVHFLLLLCTLQIPNALAGSFFTAYVPVQSQDTSDFKKASSAALLQILEKSTGKPARELLSHVSIKNEVQSAHSSVQQFSYERDISTAVEMQYLVATFSKNRVSSLLQHANLKMLLDQRPSIAVIAVTQYNGKLSVLKPGNQLADADYNDLIRASGIHGIIPLDLNRSELKALSPKNLWYFNHSYIKSLADQFKVDNVLIIRLANMSNGRWVGGSILQANAAKPDTVFNSKELNGTNFTDALTPLFKRLNQYWLSQYAARISQSQNEVVLNISMIKNFDDFKQVTQTLTELSIVDQVYVLQASSKELMLSVVLKSDFKTFQKHVQTITRLKPTSVSEAFQLGQVLDYRWINEK